MTYSITDNCIKVETISKQVILDIIEQLYVTPYAYQVELNYGDYAEIL